MENILKLVYTNSFQQYGPGPIIVWPALGKPSILSISHEQFDRKQEMAVEFLAVCDPNQPLNSLLSQIKDRISICPLLGLNNKTKRANEGNVVRIQKELIIEDDPVPLGFVNTFEKIRTLPPNQKQQGLGSEPLHYHQDFANTFAGKTRVIRIKANFELSKEIHNYLKDHSFILCNLIQELPKEIEVPHPVRAEYPKNHRILPHAICITRKQDWADLTTIQVTDLHIAKRNDDILAVIEHSYKDSSIQKVTGAVTQVKDSIKPTLKMFGQKLKQVGEIIKKETIKLADRIDPKLSAALPFKMDPEFDPTESNFTSKNIESESQEDKKKQSIALQDRFHNPNNMLRRFISIANQQAAANQLDFITMTGDLIDFALITDHPNSTAEFDLDHTNWVRFLDIILNRPISPRTGFEFQGVESTEELLVPIFTILGNHDYRAGSYSLASIGVYKLFGLTLPEAMVYKDPNPSPSALIPTHYAIRAYAQCINPFENYFFTLGSHTFIMLNSGFDTILKPQYLLMGDPSLTGFSAEQMQYLNLIRQYIIKPSSEGCTFLLSHAPVLNPIIQQAIQVGLLQKIKILPKIHLEDFKEHRLRELGESNTRSDLDLDYHCGVISSNWAETIAFLDDTKAFALNGHTHYCREFRTEKKSDHTPGLIPETPYAIYWDNYSKLFATHNENWHSSAPFHLQTPSLGFPNPATELQPGAYRVITIKNSKIMNMEVKFLQKK